MLNSKKLLYIFSDVAYVAELLPAKKPGDFTLQSFRQINGEYLNNDIFIEENIVKLFSKLAHEEYVLVLPDFFFTNTIIEIDEKAKTKIDKQITEELLPSLDLTEKTHQIQHIILTQYGEKSNVQLSAIERSLLAPIYESAVANEVKISKVVSLSWTIKALISLEPSLSLIQMGENIYLVQHYIGVDQAVSAPVSDVEKIAETVKTLRGAQPSIQTMYLLTNQLVQARIEELLKQTLPTQQLTIFDDSKQEVPPYVRQIIEAGAKTLSISDLPLPAFSLEKVDPELIKEAKGGESSGEKPEKAIEQPLPKPTQPQVSEVGTAVVTKPVVNPEMKINLGNDLPEATENAPGDIVENMQNGNPFPRQNAEAEVEKTAEKTAKKTEVKAAQPEDTLSRFIVNEPKTKPAEPEPSTAEPDINEDKMIIKNKTGVSSMLKMIFVSVAVFFLTVGIGVGLGIGYLTISQQNVANPSPVTTTVTPLPVVVTPTPVATAGAQVKTEGLSIFVVNATKKTGYANTIKKLLADLKFKLIETGNAKGTYETGNYILMAEEDRALTKLIEAATDLTFNYSSEIKTEDLKGSYDAVLVLNE